MSQPRLWILGSVERPEFQAVLEILEAEADFERFFDVGEVIEQLTTGQSPPDAIVFAQTFPGQFDEQQLRTLRRLAPVSPLISLAGSWCEGELRTGRPIQAAWRMYWHQGAARLSENLQRLFFNRLPLWGLPATAGDDERFLHESLVPDAPRSAMIAVASACYEMGDWLVAACAQRGYRAVFWQPGVRLAGVQAGIWNGSDCSSAEVDSLRRFAEATGSAPLIALLDFPRWENREAAREAGAQAIISKPLMLGDLYWTLDQLLGEVRLASVS